MQSLAHVCHHLLNLDQVAGYGSGLYKKRGAWLHRVAVANLLEEYDECVVNGSLSRICLGRGHFPRRNSF